MATTSNMFLYSLTIQPPTTITQAVLGQFSGTKEQQIVAVSGSHLTLLRPDPTQGKVLTLVSHDVFGIIRAVSSFRLAGSNKGQSWQRLVFWSRSLSDLKLGRQTCDDYPGDRGPALRPTR